MKQQLLFYILVFSALCINGVSADSPASQLFDSHSVLKLSIDTSLRVRLVRINYENPGKYRNLTKRNENLLCGTWKSFLLY